MNKKSTVSKRATINKKHVSKRPASRTKSHATRSSKRRQFGFLSKNYALAAFGVAAVLVVGLFVLRANHIKAQSSTVYYWGDFGSTGPAGPIVTTPTAVKGFSGTIKQIATSNSDTYILTTTGQEWAIGVGVDGELGNGSTTNSFTTAVQVQFPNGVTIASLPNPSPYDTALAIDTNGNVWGWGINRSGELCLGNTNHQLLPVQLPFSNVTLATGGGEHAIYYSGPNLYGCGYNGAGELGNGTFSSSMTPKVVTGLPSEAITAVASSFEGSGAVMADGSYYDWGLNNHGQLGVGNTINSAVPLKVNLAAPVSQLVQGGKDSKNGQTFTILTNGTIWEWGANNWGQLGNGNMTDIHSPTLLPPPSGTNWTYLYSGGDNSYAIDSNGNLWAWGNNNHGQLANGKSNGYNLKPKVVNGISGVTQVSSTASNVAAY